MSALSNCALYSKEHISVDEFTQKAFTFLNEFLSASDSLDIMIVENDLIVNKTPLRDAGIHGVNLMKRMKRKGISRVDFLKGITLSELKQFITDISDPEKQIMTYPHIKAGVVDVRMGIPQKEIEFDIESLSSEQVEKVKEIYPEASPFKQFKQLNTMGLEEIIVNFIATFKQGVNILRLISPMRSSSEYIYTHATNVAALSIFQAGSLGVRDDLLHDIGIAALLHDVGKLFISKEVLLRSDTIGEKEREELERHTIYGARYLAKIDALTHLAPIVALEHHLGYDCQGYPKLTMDGEKQHICSQIVAISDFFDIFRNRRPYKREWEIKEILSLMKSKAGSAFNPFYVDNFSRILLTALSDSGTS
ncbi:MAG: HD domain-containing protein [Nitrospira sp.]|nr:HD domain-containing protein [Nitrospira sp.]